MKRALGILLILAACTPQPAPVRTGLPGRGPLLDAPDRPFAFQVLVYSSEQKTEAERVTREVHLFQRLPVRLVRDEPYWRVVVGDFPQKLRAAAVCAGMDSLGYHDARIIPVRKNRGEQNIDSAKGVRTP